MFHGVLFSGLYTKPESDIIHRLGLLYLAYADDTTQLYITINKQDCLADKLSDIAQCVSHESQYYA